MADSECTSSVILPKCRLLCEVDYEAIFFYLPLLSLAGMSVVQVFLGRPRDLLPSIFPSISCSCDEL